MNREKLKGIALLFTVFVFAGSVFVSTSALKAADPSGVHVTVYQTDLLSSATGSAVTIFTNDAGKTVDIVGNPDVFGSGSIDAGTYKRIKFTVQNQVSFSGSNPDSAGLCSGLTATVNETFLIDDAKTATDHVELYFATSDDGGSSGWTANGTVDFPFLIQSPITVQANQSTVVKLIFNTAGTLVCSAANTVTVNPPTMTALNYVEQPPLTACTFPASYWGVTYNFYSSLSDTNATFQQQLERAGVDVGWDTTTFYAPDPITHVGIVAFNPDQADRDLSAEHNHGLGRFDTISGYQGYYPSGAIGTGTYTLNGSKFIINGSGGFQVEGAFSNDCASMVSVQLTGSNDNNFSYAVRKPSGLASTLPANNTYIQISNGLEIEYDLTKSSPYPAYWLDIGNSFTVFTKANNGQFFEWNPKLFLSALSSSGTTTWSSPGPGNTARFDINQGTFGENVRSDGLVTFPLDSSMKAHIFLGTSGSGLIAGEWVHAGTDDNTLSRHRMNAGLWLNAASSPLISDLTGTWVIGILDASLSDQDSTWGNGNEKAETGITYGDFTIDGAAGTMCGVFTHKNILNRTMSSESGCWTVELHTECYSCDQTTPNPNCLDITTPASSCSTNGVPGIVVPVFYMMKNGSLDAKFALDKTKTTIGIWKPIQKTTTPTECLNTTCPNSTTETMAGMGVKL